MLTWLVVLLVLVMSDTREVWWNASLWFKLMMEKRKSDGTDARRVRYVSQLQQASRKLRTTQVGVPVALTSGCNVSGDSLVTNMNANQLTRRTKPSRPDRDAFVYLRHGCSIARPRASSPPLSRFLLARTAPGLPISIHWTQQHRITNRHGMIAWQIEGRVTR